MQCQLDDACVRSPFSTLLYIIITQKLRFPFYIIVSNFPIFLLVGLQCQLDDACVSSPCHSSALCETSPVTGSYICSCRRGFEGDDCSLDVNECLESKLNIQEGYLGKRWQTNRQVVDMFDSKLSRLLLLKAVWDLSRSYTHPGLLMKEKMLL